MKLRKCEEKSNYRKKVIPRKWFTDESLPLAMKILRLMRGKQILEKCQCGNLLLYGLDETTNTVMVKCERGNCKLAEMLPRMVDLEPELPPKIQKVR